MFKSYLGGVAGVQILSSPLHFWGGASHNVTGKRQVASFLDLRLGGVNGDQWQTWKELQCFEKEKKRQYNRTYKKDTREQPLMIFGHKWNEV